jgi:hypothetical protein
MGPASPTPLVMVVPLATKKKSVLPFVLGAAALAGVIWYVSKMKAATPPAAG